MEDVLGISAYFNIDDLKEKINEVCSGLDKIGYNTKELNASMTASLNAIGAALEKGMTEKAKEAADSLRKNFSRAYSVMEDYTNKSSDQLRAFEALLEYAKKTVENLGQEIPSSIKDGISEVSAEISKQKDEIRDVAKVVKDAAKESKDEWMSIAEELNEPIVISFATKEEGEDLLSSILSRQKTAERWLTNLNSLPSETEGLSEAIRVFESALESALSAEDEVRQKLEDIGSATNNVGNASVVIKSNVEAIRKPTAETLEMFEEWKKIAEEVLEYDPLIDELPVGDYAEELDYLNEVLKKANSYIRNIAGRQNNGLEVPNEVREAWESVIETYEGYKSKIEELRKKNNITPPTPDSPNQPPDDPEEQAKKYQSLRQELQALRMELAKMAGEGNTGSEQFRQMALRAGELQKALNASNATIQYYATSSRHLETLKSTLQGVAGAASLASGIVGLFNKNNEKMIAIQTRVQSLLGIIVGMEQTFATVKKTSMLYQSALELKTWALVKARQAETSATLTATVAQKAFNLVAKANPYVLIISVLALVVPAILAVVKALNKQKEASQKAKEEEAKRVKAAREAQQQWAESVSSSAAKQMLSYEKLRRKYNELGDNLKAKEQFIRQNQDAFHQLGFSVDGVSSAESFFVQNTDKVVQAIMARAKAAAYEGLLADAYKKQIKDEINGKTVRYRNFKKGDKITQQEAEEYGITVGGGYGNKDTSLMGGMVVLKSDNAVNSATKGSFKKATENRKNQNAKNQKDNAKVINNLLAQLEDEQKKQEDISKEIGVPLYSGATTSGKKGGKGGGGNDAADQARKERERQAQEEYNQIKENERLKWEIYSQEQEKYITEIEDGAEKEKAARKWAREQRQHQLDEEKKQLLQSNIDKAKADYENNPANAKKEGFYASGLYKNVKLTDDQQKYIDAKQATFDAQNKAEDAEIEEVQKKRTEQALIEYLKAYGSFQSKREAIAKETALKIKEIEEDVAASAEEKLYRIASVQEEMKSAMQEVDFAAFKDSINWEDLFNNLDRASAETLEETRDKLRQFLNESKDLSIEDIQLISEKIQQINDLLVPKKFGVGTFLPELGAVMSDIDDRKSTAEASRLTYEKERSEAYEAQFEEDFLRGNVIDLLKKLGLDESELEDREGLKNKAKNIEGGDVLINNLDKLSIAEIKSSQKLEKASKARQKSDADAANAALNASDYGKMAAATFNDLGNALSGAGQLMEMFNIGGDEDKERVNAAAEGATAAAGAVSDYMSGNYVGAALKAVSAVKSFGTALGIGGGNAAEVNKITEENTKAIEKLTDRVNDLKDAIGNSAGQSAIYSYSLALEAQEEANRLAMETLKAQMSYTAAHHSNASHVDDKKIASYNELAQLAFKAAGVEQVNLTGLQSIYGLTPEQLKALKDYAPELWKYLTEVGDYDKTEYWEAVVDMAGQTEELTEQIYQNLTQTTLDNLRSEFTSFIMEAQGSLTDFSKDMSNAMIESLVNSQVLDDTFDAWLEDWRSRWAEALKSGTMTKSEKEALLQEYTQMAKEKQAEAEALKAQMGYSYTDEQSATRSLIQNLTADQGNQLIGRITAIQIAVEAQNAMMTQQYSQQTLMQQDATILRANAQQIAVNMSSVLEMQQIGNRHLEQIVVNTKPISEIRDIAEKIRKTVEENI